MSQLIVGFLLGVAITLFSLYLIEAVTIGRLNDFEQAEIEERLKKFERQRQKFKNQKNGYQPKVGLRNTKPPTGSSDVVLKYQKWDQMMKNQEGGRYNNGLPEPNYPPPPPPPKQPEMKDRNIGGERIVTNISLSAYEEGRQAAKQFNGDVSREKNPYPHGSDKWRSWKKGWNSYFAYGWKGWQK